MRSELACAGKTLCPRQRFKDTLKTYLSAYNLPLIFCSQLQRGSYGLNVGEAEVIWHRNQVPPWGEVHGEGDGSEQLVFVAALEIRHYGKEGRTCKHAKPESQQNNVHSWAGFVIFK